MSRTSIVAILACAGVIFTGEMSTDAVAFARAIQTGDQQMLLRFAKQNPESTYAAKAIQLADANCIVNWVGGSCTTPPLPTDGGGGSLAEPEPPKQQTYSNNT